MKKHIEDYKCTNEVMHLKNCNLQILIYKFAIAKLQCLHFQDTKYQHCIYRIQNSILQISVYKSEMT